MQSLAVIIAITLSAGYAVWRFYHVITSKESPCANCQCQGCPLKDKEEIT